MDRAVAPPRGSATASASAPARAEPPPALRTVSQDSVSNARALAEQSAESVLQSLAPSCAPAVLGRLRRERVRNAADLARLDKDDLRELGLGMVDRSRVLAWARQTFQLSGCLAGHVSDPLNHLAFGDAPEPPPRPSTPGAGLGLQMANFMGGLRRQDSANSLDGRPRSISDEDMLRGKLTSERRMHLDELECQADFWCSLASSWASPLGLRSRRAIEGVSLDEVREHLLESLFDLSHERVREVYEGLWHDSDSEVPISVEQLRRGLAQYGLTEPNGDALHRLLEAVVKSKGTCIQLAEFETILSRLTLAQLVMHLEAEARGAISSASISAARPQPPSPSALGPRLLSVVDFNARTVTEQQISDAQLRRFFFGHRPEPQEPAIAQLVRWIHMKGFNLNVLLALTVKYSLHPLAVEDTIEQAPSKAERYGAHYFTTITGLCLAQNASEMEAVRVRGYHVAIFCAGPPLLDTVITFAQHDKTFAEDWPDDSPGAPGAAGAPAAAPIAGAGAAGAGAPEADSWAGKIRRSLAMPLSRARERRADYLVYKVLDVCTDETMAVARAYIARLGWLEGQLNAMREQWPRRSLNEVTLARRQLLMIARRMRGLQRAVKKLIEDRDLGAGLSAYLQDIVEHIDEINDDCERLASKCVSMSEAYDRAVDREREQKTRALREQARRQELRRSRQADSQNSILFVLTIMTTVFAPIQFIAGVYGMNFVDENGKPTIPELLWKWGYAYFWLLVVAYLLVTGAFACCLYICMRRRRNASDSETGFDSDPSPSNPGVEQEPLMAGML